MQIRYRLLSLLAFAAFLLGANVANAQGVHLHAVLVGGNETPAAGHPTAYGTAALTFRGTSSAPQICVTMVVSGLPANPTAAHIHRGFGPQAGPVVVTLAHPATGNPGFASRCIVITPALSLEIRGNPAKFYINVHLPAPFAGGAIRGQLFN
jgi:hypothetical protein